MPDDENTFRRIDESDARRFGERTLLLVGFSREESELIGRRAERVGAGAIHCILLTDELLLGTVGEALAVVGQRPDVVPADLPRFIVLSGLSGAEVHAFLDGYASTGLPRPIFASATPTNLSFPVKGLLKELAAEHVEMMKLRGREPGKE